MHEHAAGGSSGGGGPATLRLPPIRPACDRRLHHTLHLCIDRAQRSPHMATVVYKCPSAAAARAARPTRARRARVQCSAQVGCAPAARVVAAAAALAPLPAATLCIAPRVLRLWMCGMHLPFPSPPASGQAALPCAPSLPAGRRCGAGAGGRPGRLWLHWRGGGAPAGPAPQLQGHHADGRPPGGQGGCWR